ncbi:MAG: hypothetical protein L0Y50_04050 [Beijerinckiaceae bacterium]|nr:hypothetical protein [Beijerinckiaceae bacterium]
MDSAQNIIRIVQAKGRKDRHVMLSPETLDLLRQWWKARPSYRHDCRPFLLALLSRRLRPRNVCAEARQARRAARLDHPRTWRRSGIGDDAPGHSPF